jgi:hypothetical protein
MQPDWDMFHVSENESILFLWGHQFLSWFFYISLLGGLQLVLI